MQRSRRPTSNREAACIKRITSLDREVARHLARPRFFLSLVGAFGLTALLLAAVGLYGVMAFVVAARTHDIGVRLALGASPPRIVRHMLGRGVTLVLVGIAAGPCCSASRRAIGRRSGHGGARRHVACAACWIPARAARRADPLAVMRGE